ncbi:MAG TPA: lipopolysaccharide biosynthesis protein [Vitreimonas sp.]|nr:lipopolysaccharide biosynthesis protein [Vitreimonas sp.]
MALFRRSTDPSDGRQLSRQERNARAMSIDHLENSIGRRAVQGGGLFVAAHIMKMAIQFASLAVLGRLLSPDDFGLMAMCWSVLVFASMFADLGFGAATIQKKDIDQDTVSTLFFLSLGIGILIAVIVAAFAPLAAAFFHDNRLLLAIPVMALSIPISILSTQHYGLLNRTMRWMDLQIAAVASQLAGVIVAILIAVFTPLTYWALIVQALVTAFTYSSYLIARCDWRPSIPQNWRAASSSIHLGLNLTGFTFLNYFHRQLDNILIGWRWGTIELGHYARAYALLLIPINFVNGPIGNVMQPALSRLQDKPDQWRRAYLDALIAVVLIGGGATTMLFGGAAPVIEAVYGPGWEGTISIFGVLALSMLFGTPMSTVGWLYVSLGRGAQMFRWAMIATPVYVASFLIGLPFGATGVATAYTVAVGLMFLPCFILATRRTPVSLGDILHVIWPASVCAAILGGILRWLTYGADMPRGLLLTFIAGCIYLVAATILVLTWPAYSSVKARAFATIDELRRRFLRPTPSRGA